MGLIARLHRLVNTSGRRATAEQRAKKILQQLQQSLALPKWTAAQPKPFETLVATIISQNTSDLNTERALENLAKLEITPEALAKIPLNEIEGRIKPAGLHVAKAQAIKKAAQTILDKYGGTLEPILALPVEEARKAFMQFSGVGPKTADVVLLFAAKKSTIPVDTHVDRVSKRLGLAPMNGHYEAVRASLQALYEPKDYGVVHLLLIAHGRKTCKAKLPLCGKCPVKTLCPTCGQWGTPCV